MNYQIIIGFPLIAFVAWIIGRFKPFHFMERESEEIANQKLIEEWYVKRDMDWTCVKDEIEKHGGPFGFPARLLTFQNHYESVCFSDTDSFFDKITVGTKVKFRLRTFGEGKSGRIGGMFDIYLVPVICE